MDLECASHEVKQLSSSLRSIEVSSSCNLKEVWRIRGGENNSKTSIIHGFEAVESIKIQSCRSFRNVCTPTKTNAKFDMRALANVTIEHCALSGIDEEEIKLSSREWRDNKFTTVAFPSNLTHSIHYDLYMSSCDDVEVVFEIDSSAEVSTTTNNQPPPLQPNLHHLDLMYMKRMSHVWKCNNWNKLLILQQRRLFHNLTTIKMRGCKTIKYLFSPLMAKLLSNLKTIDLGWCYGMEEVVSNRDDDKDEDEEMTTSTYTSTTLFPHLLLLNFEYLKNLKGIDGGSDDKFPQIGVVSWSLCQYSREICIHDCNGLSSVIPFYAIGQLQKLQVLKVHNCKSLPEVFETQKIYDNTNNSSCGDSSINIDEGNDTKLAIPTLAIPKQENINAPQLSTLKELVITGCDLLQHVFTFSTLDSLKKLEKLTIQECKAMKMIVKEENGDKTTISKTVEFPCLKSFKLLSLPKLKGFFFGATEFHWPSLEYVMFKDCPQMMVFTSRQSTTPVLKYIHTSLGKHSLECGLNFHLSTEFRETQLSWTSHNLIELDMENDWHVRKIIPSNELLHLQKLERIRLVRCNHVKEVFEVEEMEGTDSESQTVVEIPNLTQVDLNDLSWLKYIWKSDYHQRTVFLFPNLTTLSIDKCFGLQHVFTSSMVGSLSQLQELRVSYCYNLKVIVMEDAAMERTSESQFVVELPNLRLVELKQLDCLTHIWKGWYDQQTILKFPNLKKLTIHRCNGLRKVFTSSISGSPLHLQDTHISLYKNMEVSVNEEESQLVVFEIPNLRQVELGDLQKLMYIWKCNHHQKRIVMLFPYLTTLSIHDCASLQHVFTSSTVGSLQQLQELHISDCKFMEVIVKDELEENKEIECDTKVEEIMLPCLKTLKLKKLEYLKGFCLGKDDFSCPSLDTLEITGCPEITVFTKGHSATPALSVIKTSFT